MNEKSCHVGGVVEVAEATADPGLGDLFQVVLGRVDVIVLEKKGGHAISQIQDPFILFFYNLNVLKRFAPDGSRSSGRDSPRKKVGDSISQI